MSLTVAVPSSGQAGGVVGWVGVRLCSEIKCIMGYGHMGTLPKGPFTPSESERESENFLLCLKFFL